MVRHCSQRENSAHLGVKGLSDNRRLRKDIHDISWSLTLVTTGVETLDHC